MAVLPPLVSVGAVNDRNKEAYIWIPVLDVIPLIVPVPLKSEMVCGRVVWVFDDESGVAYAGVSRMSVEMDKSSNEVGKYMHPEAYGMPLTAGIDYHEERELAVSSGSLEAFDPNDGE